MKILVACEESQAVTIALRVRGHEAYSCDLLPCSGGYSEWHIQGDCVPAIKSRFWDIIFFFPSCQYMAVSGNRWYGKGTAGYLLRIEAIKWTLETWELIKKHTDKAVLENPVSVIFSQPGMDNHQYIQPWMFGHGETKKTGLELYNLPMLKPTNIVSGREHRIWKMGPSPERSFLRSKTFPGIAEAMADQYTA
jgi:hypothetical protein